MRRFFSNLLATMLLLVFLASCNKEEPPPVGQSDEPRPPNAQGTVTEITDRRLVLDGKQTFKISPQVQSFKTHSGHEVTAIVHWRNKYVHIGLEDDSVIWIAGIGITIPGDPRTVIYSGEVKELDDGRLIFKDGTVLKVADSLDAPRVGSRVVVTIDADRHVVSSVVKA